MKVAYGRWYDNKKGTMRKMHEGLTLLEVVIALFIFTLMVGAVFPALLTARLTGLSSKAFSEARQLAQSEVERIYAYSQSLSYPDSLYQVITHDAYTCTGFSWSTDLLTGDLIYTTPTNPVTCVRNLSTLRIDLTFRQSTTVNDPNLKDILIQVTSTNSTPEIKRYETLYATAFRP